MYGTKKILVFVFMLIIPYLLLSLKSDETFYENNLIQFSSLNKENDDYGFYFSECGLNGCFEVHNPYSFPIAYGSLTASSNFTSPLIWCGNHTDSYIIPPQKSLLIGLKSNHPMLQKTCNIRNFLDKKYSDGCSIVGKYFWELDSSKCHIQSYFILKPFWGNLRNCPDSLLSIREERIKSNPSKNISTKISKDSINISSNLFPIILSNKKNIAGLIKITNYCKSNITIENIESTDTLLTFCGLPKFLGQKTYKAIAIPSQGSIIIEYKYEGVNKKFNGDIDAFFKTKPSLNCTVLFSGCKVENKEFTINCKKEDIRKKAVYVQGGGFKPIEDELINEFNFCNN